MGFLKVVLKPRQCGGTDPAGAVNPYHKLSSVGVTLDPIEVFSYRNVVGLLYISIQKASEEKFLVYKCTVIYVRQ